MDTSAITATEALNPLADVPASADLDYYLQQIFGPVIADPLAATQAGSALSKALGIINLIALSLVVLYLVYYVIAAAVKTGESGEFLGNKDNKASTPLIIIICLTLLAPIASGWSIAQLLVLQTARLGGGLAELTYQAMQSSLDSEINTKATVIAEPIDTRQIFKMLVCAESYRRDAFATGAIIPEFPAPPATYTTAGSSYKFANLCGTIKFSIDLEHARAATLQAQSASPVAQYIEELDTIANEFLDANTLDYVTAGQSDSARKAVYARIPQRLAAAERTLLSDMRALAIAQEPQPPARPHESYIQLPSRLLESLNKSSQNAPVTFTLAITEQVPEPVKKLDIAPIDETYTRATNFINAQESRLAEERDSAGFFSRTTETLLSKIFGDGSENGYRALARLLMPDASNGLDGIVSSGNKLIVSGTVLGGATLVIPSTSLISNIDDVKSVLYKISLALIALGVMLAILIPAIPLVHFLRALITWFLRIVESLVSVVGLLVSALIDAGDTSKFEAKKVIALAAPLLLRLPLAIIGLLLSYALISMLLKLSSALLVASLDHISSLSGLILAAGLAVLFYVLIGYLAHASSSMMTKLADGLEAHFGARSSINFDFNLPPGASAGASGGK